MTASPSQNRVNSTDYVSIPDANFRAYLKGIIPEAFSGDQLDAEHQSVKSLTRIDAIGLHITSLQGIEHFTSLTILKCYFNELTSLDLSQLSTLTSLDCSVNQLASLDLRQTPALTFLYCWGNQLTSLDFSQNTALETLNFYENELISADLSQNTLLTYLTCGHNQLTHLDLRGMRSVRTLAIYQDDYPIKSLETLMINDKLKDHNAVKKVKGVHGDAIIISTYNDLNQLSCYNYDPTEKVCVTQHAPSYNNPFYTKAIFDKEDPSYEIKDEDVIKCYNEDKCILYLPEYPGTSPASRVLVLPTKAQVTVSVRKDTEQYLLNGETASKQLTLSTQGRPYGFLWDGTYWQVR